MRRTRYRLPCSVSIMISAAPGSLVLHGFRWPLLEDSCSETLEAGLDVLARLRARYGERGIVCAGHLLNLRLAELSAIAQVPLVRQELNRDFPGDAVYALDPVVEIVEGGPAGNVADGKNSLRAVEVGLLEQFAEPLLPHDVPNRHVDLQRALARRLGERELLLRDLRPEGLDVLVVKVVQNEASDQRGLADGGFADEADLHLHPPDVHDAPLRIGAHLGHRI